MAAVLDLAQYVTVTQRTGNTVRGRHAGEEHVFEHGKPKIVRYETACHIFGLDQDDKTPALARLGWARTSDEIDAALEKLKLVQFNDVSLESSDARPFVNAGESSGAVAEKLPSPDASLEGGAPDL